MSRKQVSLALLLGYIGCAEGLASPDPSSTNTEFRACENWTPDDEMEDVDAGDAEIWYESEWKSIYADSATTGMPEYYPRVTPREVTFNANNEPYMREGLTVQYLPESECDWETIDLQPVIAAETNWDEDEDDLDHPDLVSQLRDHAVYFDDDDDMYTQIGAKLWTGVGAPLLLHSGDAGANWDVYPLDSTYRFVKLQQRHPHSDTDRPPALMLSNYAPVDTLGFIFPEKDGGTLTIPETLEIEDAVHQGGSYGSNFAVSHDDSTWVAYALPAVNVPGMPTYVREYSHSSGDWAGSAVFVGYAGTNPQDNHNTPAITIDSEGSLHVILGAHHKNLYYTHSTDPYDSSEWSTPERLGPPAEGDLDVDPNCPLASGNPLNWYCNYYTYATFLADESDNLHLVTRYSGKHYLQSFYYFRVSYLRKLATEESWDPRVNLLRDWRTNYVQWMQKLTTDRTGRLYLYFGYYTGYFTAAEAASYETAFGEDLTPDNCDPQQATRCPYLGATEKWPGILTSDDSGDSWRLATSADMVASW
jgi:hypothetical protein